MCIAMLQHRDIVDYEGPQLCQLRAQVFQGTLIGRAELSEIAALNDGLSIKVSESIQDISAVSTTL
jgi:hypothetical protein